MDRTDTEAGSPSPSTAQPTGGPQRAAHAGDRVSLGEVEKHRL